MNGWPPSTPPKLPGNRNGSGHHVQSSSDEIQKDENSLLYRVGLTISKPCVLNGDLELRRTNLHQEKKSEVEITRQEGEQMASTQAAVKHLFKGHSHYKGVGCIMPHLCTFGPTHPSSARRILRSRLTFQLSSIFNWPSYYLFSGAH